MYDKDILSEKVILKWAEKPLKHRFSCLTDKFLKELSEVAQPMVEWLKWAPRRCFMRRTAEPSDVEEETIDLDNAAEEEKEGEEKEEGAEKEEEEEGEEKEEEEDEDDEDDDDEDDDEEDEE